MDDAMHLGGNIDLFGFGSVDKSSMIILKKIIGNYARKFSEKSNFEKLSISMRNGNNSFELNSTLITNGKSLVSEKSASNLFYAVDECLKQMEKGFGFD